jgi:glycine/D-amino acid oxidase-like deaminating enzyme
MNLTTGLPYWLMNSGLPAPYPKLRQPVKTEVVIIGGGISGALTAYSLINAGVKCIVVDARAIGLGSTCASTSLLQYELDKPLSELSTLIGWNAAMRSYKLCSQSIDTLERITRKIKFIHFQRQESLFFCAYKKDKQMLEAEYAARKKSGFDVQFLNEKDIKKQFGFYATAAILSAQGATTDAYLLTHALLQDSIKSGLDVFDHTEITKIDYTKRSVKLVTSNGILISANKIVNASGYEIMEFIEKKIVKLNSTYAIASEHLPLNILPWKKKAMLWNTANPYLYMRLTNDNRIIIGGRDEEYYNPKKRDKLLKRKSLLLKKDFKKLFPDIELIPEFSWTGTFGSTKDALPFIGTYSKTPHTYYALGFGGNGITFSVIAAEIIRDMILGKNNKNQSLFSFSS